MSASTPLSDVLKILDKCAPGYTIRLANHSRVIQFGGKVYRAFPKHDPVENGHVRKLIRFLGIGECASQHLPGVISAPPVATEKPQPTKPEKTPPRFPKKK
jgi:hypothetical protein